MRIVHVADTHLGYRNFSGKLDPTATSTSASATSTTRGTRRSTSRSSSSPTCSSTLATCSTRRGRRPSPSSRRSGVSRSSANAGIPAMVIAGNHSTPRFRSGGSVFEILEHVGYHRRLGRPRIVRVNGLAVHCVPHEPSAEQLLADIRGLPRDARPTATSSSCTQGSRRAAGLPRGQRDRSRSRGARRRSNTTTSRWDTSTGTRCRS